MAYIGRKITGPQWAPKPDLAHEEVSADALSKDLRTSGNALSFWRADDRPETEPWLNAALAMSAAAERLDAFDIVWIEPAQLLADGITVVDTVGATPIADLKDMHVDVARLDVMRLAQVARHIAAATRAPTPQLKRVTRHEAVTMLVAAVAAGRLRVEDLKDSVRKDVSARMPRP